MIQKGGFTSMDRIVERIENNYWKIQVDDFQYWMLGFNKFVGEWKTTEIESNKILIEYTYTLHAQNILLYPFNWLFIQLFWRKYMKRVIKIIQELLEKNEPYKYD